VLHNDNGSETDKYITNMFVYNGDLLKGFMKNYWTFVFWVMQNIMSVGQNTSFGRIKLEIRI